MLAGVNSGFRRDMLRVLRREGGLSGADIQRKLERRDYEDIDHPRVYNGMVALESQGLVVRDTEARDGRTNEYRLTEKARQRVDSDWRVTA